jgi:hypothetical protein
MLIIGLIHCSVENQAPTDLSSNIEAVRALFLRWWMRWCEVVEFEVVECEVVEFEVVDVHHLIY